jgi:Tol biopolymer transport system component
VRTPAVSPDGRRIVFQVYRDGAWEINVADGSMKRILDDKSAEEFAWTPDGAAIAYHSRRNGEWSIWRVDVPL